MKLSASVHKKVHLEHQEISVKDGHDEPGWDLETCPAVTHCSIQGVKIQNGQITRQV